jgi:hypothetical protein
MMSRTMSPSPRPTIRALVIAAPGPGRDALVAELEALGLVVLTASDLLRGIVLYVESPTELVVVSLAGVRQGKGDMPFFRTVRRRGPATRILLLVPEGRRELARRALAAGADVWLPEPWHREELISFARCLLPVPTELHDLGPESMEAVRLLSSEVSHAVNNPLQILRLVTEQHLKGKHKDDAISHVGRIGDVVRIAKGFGELRAPRLREAQLGTLVRESVSEAEERGAVKLASALPRDGVHLQLDPQQVRYAVDVLVSFLAALGGDEPVPLKVGVHRAGPRRPPPARAGRPGPFLEAAFKARGVVLDPTDLRRYRGQVICSHDETRIPYPGLAPVALVARTHAGRLETRVGKGGTIFGLCLPLP